MSHKKDVKEEDDTAEVAVIVIDHGSAYIKAGFAGHDAPRLVVPTLVGRSRGAAESPTASSSSSSSSTQEFVGADALHAYRAESSEQSIVQLTSPIERGEITDWDALHRIWEFVFRKLRVDPARYAVLLTLPPPVNHTQARATRERVADYFFQHFRVRSLCVFNACVLSLFATGRTCGLVLECGEGASYAVPVFEGFALPHASTRLPLAGADLSAHLAASLNRAQRAAAQSADGRAFLAAQQIDQPFEFVLPAHIDVVRDLKEKRLVVLPDADAVTPHSTQAESVYELPDGQFVHVDAASRFRAAEILFAPAEYDEAVPKGVHELAYDAIAKCDNFLQRDLFRNVVVAGGTSMLDGFGVRLQNELSALDRGAHEIEVVQDSQRRHAAWIGGSMFGSLPTFQALKVTRQEYEESPQSVHKKYF